MRSNFRHFRRVLLVSLSLTAGCAGLPSEPVPTPLEQYQQAYDQGRAKFTQELAEGDANVEVLGGDSAVGFDEESGLPQVFVNADVMDKLTAGRVAGHNDALHEYIDQYGLPANSRKKWEKDLLHLSDYFQRRSREQTPAHLVSGAGHEVSPDGRFTLMLRETSADSRPSSPGPELILVRQSDERAVALPAGVGDRPDTSMVWGPDGSDTAIFQFKPAVGAKLLAVLDLRSGRWLLTELASAPERLTRS